MASTATSEASEIRRRGRRRLIGAIALVVLLVVFVPMVLDSEPRPSLTGPSAVIPPKENAPALPPPPPAKGEPAKAAPAEPPKAAPAEPPKAAVAEAAKASPAEAARVTPVAPATEPAAADKSPPAKAPADSPKLQGFAVQVGAFRDEAKLKQSREKLAAAGVVHYTERLDSKSGPLTRLRAGPFATRAEAEAALAKLKRSSVEGKVVPLP